MAAMATAATDLPPGSTISAIPTFPELGAPVNEDLLQGKRDFAIIYTLLIYFIPLFLVGYR